MLAHSTNAKIYQENNISIKNKFIEVKIPNLIFLILNS